MSAAMTTYRAKADCRVGGFFRRKGEEFDLPPFGDGSCPVFLEVVSAVEEEGEAENKPEPKTAKPDGKKPKTAKPASIPKNAQVSKADIGAGTPVSSADVTSVDMVTK